MSATMHRVDTPAGTLVTWSNGRNPDDGTHHVGVRTENTHGRYPHNAPVGGWDGVAATVRLVRVDYTVSDHYRYDGTSLTPYDHTGPLRRVDRYDRGSDAAERAYRATILPAVLAFLDTDAGRAMLADGERDRVAYERLRLTRERAELADKLAAVDAELAALPADSA